MSTRRLFRGLIAAFAIVALSWSSLHAQPPQGGGGRGGQRGGFGFGFGGPGGMMGGGGLDRATLLGSSQVRDELKIEEAQAATIEAALEAYRDERRSTFQGFRDLSEDERAKAMEEARQKSEALSKKTDEILGALLEPAQVERLDQIALQARLNRQVAAALKSDSLKSKLGISDEQLAKLTAIEENAQKKQREMFEQMRSSFQPGGGGDRESMREQFEKMRTEGDKLVKSSQDEAMAVLTDAQKSQLESLKGAPFELDMRSLMGGRGGFGGPGGPGGPGGFGGPGGPGGGRGGNGGRGERQRPATDDSI